MKKLRIIIPIIAILLIMTTVVFAVPAYVNVGPTTEFEGDVGVPSGSGYYINDVEITTALGMNPEKVYTISPSGGDYTSIHEALAARTTGDELFLVYPDTYVDDYITFSADNQSVVGMGLTPNQYITNSITIVDFGAYTGCKLWNIKAKMTVTDVDDLMIGSGSIGIRNCHFEVAASGAIAGNVPIINTTGTVKMNKGSLVSDNTAASGGQIKSVLVSGAGSTIALNRVEVTITGSGAATAHTLAYGAGTGTLNVCRCSIDIDDNVASITSGIYCTGSGAKEFIGNDIHVDNDAGYAYGYYFSTGTTMAVRSMYNHLHVTNSGSAHSYAWSVGSDVTLTSQFDDIVAADSTVAGTLHEASSMADGAISLSDELYTDAIKEYTAAAGVTIDGVVLKDSLVGIGYGGTGVATGAMVNFTSIYNASLKFGRDADNLIDFATTDNNIIFRTNGANGALIYTTGELDMNANSIGFTQQAFTATDATTTIDWKLGNKFEFTFDDESQTFTFTAPTNPCNLLLKLIQDGVTGSYTVTWPGTVMWAGGTAPTLSTAVDSIDIVSFYWDGTNYFGVCSLDFS